jgi:aspartyl-tRNA(Asn)/glutamyl-tRNA(Gln) amidotransferase subunit A
MVESFNFLPLSEQVNLIHNGAVSAEENVKAHLNLINSLNPRLNSFITIDSKGALEQARKLDKLRLKGEALGPLAGVILGIKDSIPTKNLKTTNNSRLLEKWIPNNDASVIKKLRNAGAIIIGKTNLNEFGWSRPSELDLMAPPWSPWNTDRMSVGSSSGSGAATAARMVGAALGTDGGGSARLPAGANNLYSIKPTHGLVSRFGMDHNQHSEISPLCRTAIDVAMMLEVMAGYESKDDMSWPQKIPKYTNMIKTDISGWRIGVPYKFVNSAPNEPEVKEAYDKFLHILEELGCDLVEIDLRGMLEARTANFIQLNSEAYQRHQKTLRSNWEDYGKITRVYLLQGAFLSANDMLNAAEIGRAFKNYFSDMLSENNLKAIATPTSPFATAERSRLPHEHSRGINACFTAPFNISGHPSMSLPAGFGESDIPVGAMLTGGLHDDLSLLQLAFAYDERSNLSNLIPELLK